MIRIEDALKGFHDLSGLKADFLDLEWHEVSKTTMRRKTRNGVEIAIRKKNRKPLENGDLLHVDKEFYIELHIKPCDIIVIRPRTMREMGMVCFEIGNQHLPIHIDAYDHLYVAYEAPLFTLLQEAGYDASIEKRQLLDTHVLQIGNKHWNRH